MEIGVINDIDYEYEPGPKGSQFVLYPEQGKHTELDVTSSIGELKSKHGVISLQVRWKKKDDKMPPPEKVPDYLIIKRLQQTIGELKASITELEDKHKDDLAEEQRAIRKEVQSEELYTQLKKEKSKVQRENKGLRENISELVAKLNSKTQQ